MMIADSSAVVIAHQMPSRSKKIGRIRTEIIWNTSVRRKEIVAETAPLLRAVKKADVKMLMPASKNEKENSRKACLVISNNSAS